MDFGCCCFWSALYSFWRLCCHLTIKLNVFNGQLQSLEILNNSLRIELFKKKKIAEAQKVYRNSLAYKEWLSLATRDSVAYDPVKTRL